MIKQIKLFLLTIYFFVGIILILVAGLRTVGMDPDSGMYADYVTSYIDWAHVDLLDKEPGFWVIVSLVHTFFKSSITAFFIIYASLSIIPKLFMFFKMSSFPLMTLLLYISTYFILHDMNQIRIGFACVFILAAIPDILNKKPINFFLKIAVATIFHYSAIIGLLFYIFNADTLDKKKFALLPLIGIATLLITKLLFTYAAFIINFLPNFLSNKVNIYFNLQDQGLLRQDNPLVFSLGGGITYFLLLFLIWKSQGKTWYEIILIKILSLQLFLAVLLSFNHELSNRFYTLIGFITIPLLLPNIILYLKPRWIPYSILLIYAIRQLYSSIVGVFLFY